MGSFLEIISVFLMSTVKFVFGGVPLALYYGFSFFKAVTITSLGGFVGVSFFIFMSEELIEFFKKRKALARIKYPLRPLPKKFTRKNKIIVIVMQRFGLIGISLLTPLLLSIPIGCFIAVRYFKDKQNIVVHMFGSVLFWSVTMYFLYKPLINAIRTHLF